MAGLVSISGTARVHRASLCFGSHDTLASLCLPTLPLLTLWQVCFDRGGFRYHGRVQALADAAREAGLHF